MDTVIAVDVGGTKLAARSSTPTVGSSRAPWPQRPRRRPRVAVRRTGLGRRVAARRSAQRRRVRCRVWRADARWRRARLAAQHSGVARPLRERLGAHTGLPTWVDNDAKALALGEGWIGAAAGERDYIAMVVSTGVGGGIVLDGRLLDGADGNAGHVGHVIVEPGGGPLRLQAHGCTGSGGFRHRDPRHHRPVTGARDPELIERSGTLVGRAVASVAEPARPVARGRRTRSHWGRRTPVLRRGTSRAPTSGAASTSHAARASFPAVSAPTAPSSAPPASPYGMPSSRRYTAGG